MGSQRQAADGGPAGRTVMQPRLAWPLIPMAILFGSLAACADEGPQPVLRSVEPTQAYSDQPARLRLRGDGFVPVFLLDLEQNLRLPAKDGFAVTLHSAAGLVELANATWVSPRELEVELPPVLAPASVFDVKVVDPRGKSAVLPQAFTSLGPDVAAPDLKVLEPAQDRPLAAGVMLPVRFAAEDRAPGTLTELRYRIRWRQQVLADGPCALAIGGAATTCAFEAFVPEEAMPGDHFHITLTATDGSAQKNRTERTLAFILQPRPRLLDVEPQVGSVEGGTDVVIRGMDFARDSQVLIGGLPLVPDGGRYIDSQTITGRSPPAPQGFAVVELVGPTGTSKLTRPKGFTYLPAHEILDVVPARVRASGGVKLVIRGSGMNNQTRIVFGDVPSSAVPLIEPEHVSASEIRGFAPAGIGKTVVWAVDPLLGKTRWRGTFEWVQEGAP